MTPDEPNPVPEVEKVIDQLYTAIDSLPPCWMHGIWEALEEVVTEIKRVFNLPNQPFDEPL